MLFRLFVVFRELLRYFSLVIKVSGANFLLISTVAESKSSLYLEAERILKPLEVESLGSLIQSCL